MQIIDHKMLVIEQKMQFIDQKMQIIYQKMQIIFQKNGSYLQKDQIFNKKPKTPTIRHALYECREFFVAHLKKTINFDAYISGPQKCPAVKKPGIVETLTIRTSRSTLLQL